nr:phosphoribosylformimino-5-aminoimidazole carboxamide ribotide isomerase [uncultured Acetatifactor sp.]
MEFRPCIDIHNGQVKQIEGGSLQDRGDLAKENFVSGRDASYFAELYKNAKITGGHVILLNSSASPYYSATKAQALKALRTYPGGLQVGGGITAENAGEFLQAGASHVIVTSYIFHNGAVRYDRLKKLSAAVGREHLVLDISCRRTAEGYLVATDRWQKLTREKVSRALLKELEDYCNEFLIHAVDVEGKGQGIEQELVALLGDYEGIPVTYAGGVHSYEDLELIKELGKNRVNVTIGSALDLFGGMLEWRKILTLCRTSLP